VSDKVQPVHLRSEGFWTDDPPDVPASAWYARCLAGVLHDPEGESIVCLCGLDEKEWPEGLEAGDGPQIGGLPRVEGPPTFAAWSVHPTVSAEQAVEQVDGMGLDHPDSDALGVDGLGSVAADPHGVGAALDADGAVSIDDPGEVSEEVRVHHDTLTGGGEVTSLYYRDDWLEVHRGDARDVLAGLQSESVHCVVTSPP